MPQVVCPPTSNGRALRQRKPRRRSTRTPRRTLLTHSTVEGGGGYIEVVPLSGFPGGSVLLASDLPYVFVGASTISAATHVTIAPGVVVKFAPQSPTELGELIVHGSLQANGTATAPVIFTSVHDDSAGGHIARGEVRSPQAGDWYGIAVAGGAAVTMDYAHVRYARSDLWLQSSGNAISTWDSTLSDAGAGIESGEGNTVSMLGAAFERDGAGARFTGGTLGYAPVITNARFAGNGEGISVNGGSNLTVAVHGSSFTPTEQAVYTTGSASVNATGNWWGAASGPRPVGGGALVTGNVVTGFLCGNTTCTSDGLALSPSSILADGHAVTTATVSVQREGHPVWGDTVTLSASSPEVNVGPVHDNLDGTYTATLTAGHSPGAVTLTATDSTPTPAAVTTAAVEEVSPTVSLHLAPGAMLADGFSSTTATVTVTGPQGAAPGQSVVLSSTDPGQLLGPLIDHGDGTYTATLTASETLGTSSITAADESLVPSATASAPLSQTSPAPDFGRRLKVSAGAGRFGNSACTASGGSRKYSWLRRHPTAETGLQHEAEARDQRNARNAVRLAADLHRPDRLRTVCRAQGTGRPAHCPHGLPNTHRRSLHESGSKLG